MSPNGDRSASPNASNGAILIVTCFVACQFVDVTIATLGTFVLSVQKLVAIVVLPFGAALLPRIRFSPHLICFLLAMGLAFCVAPGLGGYESAALANTLVTLVLGFLAATIVYSSLASSPRPVVLVGRIWVAASIVTSLLAIGQVAGVVPLFAVAADSAQYREAVVGVQRASGLKEDANFAAMMLVVGMIFARYLPSSRTRIVAVWILAAGVAATLSRMGIILAIVVVIMTSEAARGPARSLSQRILSRTATIVVLCGSLFTAFSLTSGNLRLYLDERTEDLRVAATTLLTGQSSDVGAVSSGAERAALFRGTLDVIRDNALTGVGPGNVPSALYQTVGLNKPAHNTYLETAAVGGIFGLLALITYALLVASCLRRASRMSQDTRQKGVAQIRLLCLCVGVMAAVLTLTYNAFIWLPLIMAAVLTASEVDESIMDSSPDRSDRTSESPSGPGSARTDKVL